MHFCNKGLHWGPRHVILFPFVRCIGRPLDPAIPIVINTLSGVLYNGTKPYPEQVTLKLSDCFEAITELTGKAIMAPELELTVKVYNINQGCNEEIVRYSENLRGYSSFIARVRENKAAMPLEAAMKEAIEYCIERNILSAFLLKYSTEVQNMLLTEWNIDDAKEVWQEEGWEKGRVKTVEEVLELIKQEYTSEEEIRKRLSAEDTGKRMTP